MNNINFLNKIDLSKLKRDYYKYPIITNRNGIGSEQLSKDELEYLYIDLNLTKDEIAFYTGMTYRKVTYELNKYHIIKTKELNKIIFKKSCLEKYGVDNPNKIKIVRDKIKQTNLEKYGVDSYAKTDNWKKQVRQTNLEKYGVENNSKTDNWKKLIYQNKNKINEKIFNTKRKNNSFNKSKEEDKIYELLIQKYPDTIRQHKSDLYPFYCDFYIPELDLYIEYQKNWMHGKEPYIGTDEQKEIIKLWEEKSNEINFKGELKRGYYIAINTWTIRDTLKRETAKKNNLNWIEFFNMNEFMDWYKNIDK